MPHSSSPRYGCTLASDSGQFCTRWFGVSESEEEFERSQCECVKADTNDDGVEIACAQWKCDEKGLHYWTPNYWVACFLGVFLLVPGFFVGMMVVTGVFLIFWMKQVHGKWVLPDGKFHPVESGCIFLGGLAAAAGMMYLLMISAGYMTLVFHGIIFVVLPCISYCCGGGGVNSLNCIRARMSKDSATESVIPAAERIQPTLQDGRGRIVKRTCTRCGSPAHSACAGCHTALYCSRTCQVNHWHSHEKVCIVSQGSAARARGAVASKPSGSTSKTMIGAILEIKQDARKFKTHERIKERFDAKKSWKKALTATRLAGALGALKQNRVSPAAALQ